MSEVISLNEAKAKADAERAKMKLPKVSILTPTYKRHDLMAQALRSVAEAALKYPFEWIIMDNGGEAETTSKFAKECLHLDRLQESTIFNGDNSLNYAQMNNKMAKMASGKYLLFLNNDIVALKTNDFIAPLVELLEQDEAVGAAGSVLVYPTKAVQHAGVIFTSELEPVNYCENSIRFLNLYAEPYNHDRTFQAATGACLLVRRADFEAVGGFTEAFNWAYEDIDLCLKIHKELGKTTVVSSKSVLIHRESQSGAKPKLRDMLKLFRETWTGYMRGDAMAYQSDFRRYFPPHAEAESTEDTK